jgi:hypothetical protein
MAVPLPTSPDRTQATAARRFAPSTQPAAQPGSCCRPWGLGSAYCPRQDSLSDSRGCIPGYEQAAWCSRSCWCIVFLEWLLTCGKGFVAAGQGAPRGWIRGRYHDGVGEELTLLHRHGERREGQAPGIRAWTLERHVRFSRGSTMARPIISLCSAWDVRVVATDARTGQQLAAVAVGPSAGAAGATTARV